jgi:hypothetical protein
MTDKTFAERFGDMLMETSDSQPLRVQHYAETVNNAVRGTSFKHLPAWDTFQ